MRLETCKLDPAELGSRLAWQAALKKIEIKLNLLSDINMVLMVERDIRGGICHSIYQYANADNKYMKIMTKMKNHHLFIIGI